MSVYFHCCNFSASPKHFLYTIHKILKYLVYEQASPITILYRYECYFISGIHPLGTFYYLVQFSPGDLTLYSVIAEVRSR